MSFVSCQDKKQTTETSSIATDLSARIPSLENYSPAFKAILTFRPVVHLSAQYSLRHW
jgi:hypothetical protein